MHNKKTLQSWFYNKKSKLKNEAYEITFESSKDFYDWFTVENTKGCHYCGLKEEEQIKLIERELIKSKRFSTSSGKRGNRLEVDRKNSEGDYSKENCVLSCYFCNNDKSDVFSESQYFEFTNHGKTRVKFLRRLLK
jgi:hypothetical protein